jgi:L-fuconolactonase
VTATGSRVIDTHVHFWDRGQLDYAWLDHADEVLKADHLPRHLADTGWRADAIIAVQADCRDDQALAEARWLHELEAHGAPIAGVIAHAPLEATDGLKAHLDALVRLPLVVGVRRLLQDAPAGLATSASFVSGVRSLAGYGLTMDLCIRQHQLAEVTHLVEQCPEVTFVLDHLGKPSIQSSDFDEWATDLAALAALPNVAAKLSGLSTEAAPEMRSAEALAPWLRHTVDVFGAERSMFGSDWPVVDAAGGFEQWAAVVSAAIDDLSDEQAASVWSGTAESIYLSRTRQVAA